MQRQLIAGAIAALSIATAHAGPADYVYTPSVEQGEIEVEFKFGTAKEKNEKATSAAALGVGYGVNSWWFTEIASKWKRDNRNTYYDAVEWENRFQLTETGKYPVDLGFLLEIERPQNRSEGYEVKYGPLLQSDWGKLQFNANFLFERSYRAAEGGQLNMSYQLQAKYRWRPEFEFGLQAFGETGKWNDWEKAGAQEQSIGPAIFGKIKLGSRQAIKYNAALLIGTTSHSPERTLRTQVEYEF